MARKGIILAGGSGTRLYPITKVVSKQLLPVFDKPMIYYPISTLMVADIKEILIITTPKDLQLFKDLLGDGSQFGINLEYSVQNKPNGIAEALLIAEDFLKGSESVLILGDNIFYGSLLRDKLKSANNKKDGSTIFAYRVKDPNRYGIAEFDQNKKVINLEEKPTNPKSNYAITGIYFYDKHAPKHAKSLQKSTRGELEITDLNAIYLDMGKLYVEIMNRGMTWLDTGTPQSMQEANQFVETVENRQGLKIACLEEIAFKQNWITKEKVEEYISRHKKNSYFKYLEEVINEKF